jgi:pyruvate kinase
MSRLHTNLRRTKIVATVGPASREPVVLDELIRAGVNVFRLNLSHGSHEEHRENYLSIRAAARKHNEPVAILADLCGPKIRVGKFQIDPSRPEVSGGSIKLTPGQNVIVTTRDVIGHAGLIPSQYAALAQDVSKGDRILLDDGLLELRVDSTDGTEVACTVLSGGVLKERKGMNLPNVAVSSPALTDKDRADAEFAIKLGVDFLALSFVRRPWDITELKRLIESHGIIVPIIAKIEKPEAIDCLDEIVAEADGLMVARGDLGVEMPPETVPLVQRDLIQRCRKAAKPVIVATQMLESMIHSPRPTRAEVSDVSTAVYFGADAVMLSAETAAGLYPVPAVQMMDRVARQMEGWQGLDGRFEIAQEEDENHRRPLRHALAHATADLSADLRVEAIIVRTQKGTSAGVMSSSRPAAPIVVLTHDEKVARRLNLSWGTIPCVISEEEYAHPQQAARRFAADLGLAEKGETILLLTGFGKNEPSITVLTM